MNSRAQAGLEYLMTYGWALIIIATVVGVLVFVVGTPVQETKFSSSQSNKILLKSSTADSTTATAVLQNITGGQIEITGIEETGFTAGTCTIDSSETGTIGAGESMFLECEHTGNPTGTVTITYNNFAGLEQTATITGSSSGTSGGGSCIDGATKPCALQQGTCSGSIETCTGGNWPGCGAADYLANNPNYEAMETSCFDSQDNDCDNSTDCTDPNCSSNPLCGGVIRLADLCCAACSPDGCQKDYSWFDFETASDVIPGDIAGDLDRDYDWHVFNGATQVLTSEYPSNFDSVTCGPSDGRTYSDTYVSCMDGITYVSCLRTAGGAYIKWFAFECNYSSEIIWARID